MKRIIEILLIFVFIVSGLYCLQESTSTIQGNIGTYYKMSDGTWRCEDHVYKYRLEISGRMPNAAKDTTYVYLSNLEEISFHRAMMASGLSSDMNDYFSSDEAILVEIR